MKRLMPVLSLLIALGFGQVHLGCCPQQECGVLLNDSGYRQCVYWGNTSENSNRRVVNFGDSVAVGASCLQKSGIAVTRCGYIQPLEAKLGGTQIANFSTGDYTALAEVNSGFSFVHQSVDHNPDVKRVYMHIGANDAKNYIETHCAQFPMAFNPGTQACEWVGEPYPSEWYAELSVIVGNVRSIVQEYQTYGNPGIVREIIVGSLHPVEETGDHLGGCRGICPGTQHYRCLNEILETAAVELENMVASLGGASAGVYYADHFHDFPVQEPAPCSISCDCAHPNCHGHDLMAQIWYDALPTVPTP